MDETSIYKGRNKKFKTVSSMRDAWEEYKRCCDNKTVLTHTFSAKNSEYVSESLKKRVAYSVVGFCTYVGMSRQNYYKTYARDPAFAETVAYIRDSCEADTVEKFQTGELPPQLAGLLLSRYGYTGKSESSAAPVASVIISGADKLED